MSGADSNDEDDNILKKADSSIRRHGNDQRNNDDMDTKATAKTNTNTKTGAKTNAKTNAKTRPMPPARVNTTTNTKTDIGTKTKTNARPKVNMTDSYEPSAFDPDETMSIDRNETEKYDNYFKTLRKVG